MKNTKNCALESMKLTKKQLQMRTEMEGPVVAGIRTIGTIADLSLDQLRVCLYRSLKLQEDIDKSLIAVNSILQDILP